MPLRRSIGGMSCHMTSPNEFLVHKDPIWREKSNFIITAELPEKDSSRQFEQLFARQLTEETFEICCIPFFLYDIALGDVVVTSPRGDRRYMVKDVLEPSGRYVFRVWF